MDFEANARIAAEITDEVRAQLPEEKCRAEREMAQTAKDVRDLGIQSDRVDGRGQAICSIPPILYMRWHQQYPGCWKDRQFVDEFLSDNPQCQLPGYKPKPKVVRFNMRVQKLASGSDIYHQNKHRIMADVKAEKIANG